MPESHWSSSKVKVRQSGFVEGATGGWGWKGGAAVDGAVDDDVDAGDEEEAEEDDDEGADGEGASAMLREARAVCFLMGKRWGKEVGKMR